MRKFLDEKLFLTFLLGIILLLTGCRPGTVPIPTAVMDTATPEIISVISTSTQFPAPTPIPTQRQSPTATVGPELILTEPHLEISYTIPLTSQWVSETAAVFHFALDELAEGFLFYGLVSEGAFTEAVSINGNDLDHQITINGLEKDTLYQAAVGLFTEAGYRLPRFLGEQWDPIQFRTSAADQWPIRIGVIGDSGFGGQVTRTLTEQMADYDPDFVLHTGDVVYRVEENADAVEAFIAKYYLPFSAVLHEMPIYPVPGNHEYDAAAIWGDDPYYYAAFPPLPGWISGSGGELRQFYALELGSVQFIFLDTQEFWQEQGVGEQTLWLEERLKDNRFLISIPVLHVPPFSSGLHASEGVIIERVWVPLFERYNVPLVLSGHDHNYQRLIVNGITYVISGGGSNVLYTLADPHPGSMFFSATSHFVLLSLYRDRLELEAISMEDEVIESVVIELGIDPP
jgi:predicted phosphodiesterase